MKNLIIILSLFLFSCNATKPFTAQPTQERITTITEQVHDTVLVVKADTVSIAAKLEVDSVGKITIDTNKIATKKTSNKASTALLKIIDNTIYADCYFDTASIYFKWKTTQTKDSITIIKVPPPLIIEKPITKWRWFQIWVGRTFLFLLLLYIILYILKHLNYI